MNEGSTKRGPVFQQPLKRGRLSRRMEACPSPLKRGTFQQPLPGRDRPAWAENDPHAFARNGRRQVFASMRYAGEAARRPALTGSVAPLDAFPPRSVHSSRLGRSIPPALVGMDSPVGTKAHFPAFAVVGFSRRRDMLERPPVGPRLFRRRGERESGRRPDEARMVQNANNNFRKIR